jgi:hypothetical protein
VFWKRAKPASSNNPIAEHGVLPSGLAHFRRIHERRNRIGVRIAEERRGTCQPTSSRPKKRAPRVRGQSALVLSLCESLMRPFFLLLFCRRLGRSTPGGGFVHCCVAPIGEPPECPDEFKAAKLFCTSVTCTTLPLLFDAPSEFGRTAFPIPTV